MSDPYLLALASSMEVDPAVIDTVGVTIAPHHSRADSGLAVGYLLGQRLVVACDPAVAAMLEAETQAMAPTLDGWVERATALGAESLGCARQQVLTSHDLPEPVIAAGYAVRELDAATPADLALIEHLVETSDEDDLDEAEIELDDLDDYINVIVAADGHIASFSSSRPFDLAPEYHDIGIMTRPQDRGIGLGTAAVTSLCHRLIAADIEPLYRCDEGNAGSMALSDGMGFAPRTRLAGFRFSQS